MYIVTGGAGFIGSAFLKKLNDSGVEDILVVDNLGSSEKWKNLSGKRFADFLHKQKFLEIVANDRLHDKIEAVIHFGACSSTIETNAEYMMENNYRYTRVLAEWALQKNLRFVYASSAATYGDGNCGFSDDDDNTRRLRPLNVYAYSKQSFDMWAITRRLIRRMVGLKFFNVYGPNEYHKGEMTSVIYKAFNQIKETGSLCLFKSYRTEYGDGEQKRDFVYVKDCSDIVWWLLQNPQITGLFNLGTGCARSWNDLARAIFAAMGKSPSIEYIEMPPALKNKYQYYTQATMYKLAGTGCPQYFHSLEDGVREYVQQYLLNDCSYL